MSNNIKYALQFWKNFSKNLILGLSFLMLLFGIIASQGNIIERGMSYVTAQEVGDIELIEPYDPYAGTITEEPAYDPYYYSEEPAPEVGNITQYESQTYEEPSYSYSEPEVGNISEIYTEGPGCDGTHAVWGKWSGSSLVSVEADYGETGECGYSSSSSSSSSSSDSQGYDPYAGSSSTQSYSNTSSGSYEGPGCDGSHSVWGEWSSDGRLLRVEADYGAQSGECNNPVSGSTNYGSTSSSSSSGTWEFKYPQCQGNQVVDVYQHTGTGAYEERNPHYQEDACGYNQTWEGPGCQGNRSVWGIWGGADRSRLISVERDYGVKPGECNNPYTTSTTYSPTPTYAPAVSYEDRIECDGGEQVTRRYFTNGQRQIVTRHGRMPGYCGVAQPAPYTPVYNTTPFQGTGGYYAPYPTATGTYTVPSGVNVPVTTIQNNLVPMQISCSSDSTMIQRGGSVTYYANSIIGGSGRVARYVFSGEGTQSSSSAYFVKSYPTSGVKYMRMTVYDADSRVSPQTVDCPVISVYEPTQVQNVGYPQSFQGSGGYYAPYPNSAPPPFQGTGGYYAPYPNAAPPPFQGTGGYYAPYANTAPPAFQGTGGYYAPYPEVAPAPYQGTGGYYAPYSNTSAPPPYQGTGAYYAPYPVVGASVPYQGTGAYYDQTGTVQPQVAGSASTATPNTRAVTIGSNVYQPGNMTINPGESVTWTNRDTMAHTVTSDNNSWASQTLQPGQSMTVTFPNPGTFAYHCELHPGMRGTVTVGGATAPATTAPATTSQSNSNVKVVLGAANPATPTATTPQVTTNADAGVTELPKTGLPLVAWGVSALLPLGLKMRKGKKSAESEPANNEVTANSIWLQREMSK